MTFFELMERKWFAVLMVAFSLVMGTTFLASAVLAIGVGDLWLTWGLPAGFFILASGYHLFGRYLRRPRHLRFTRDSAGVRIHVNRVQLHVFLTAGIALTLPGAWGLCVALATGSTWWPWLIPTALFAPTVLIFARSIARRPTLFLNPHTVEFTGPSSESGIAWEDVDCIVSTGEPPLEQLNIVGRPGAASWWIRRFRLAARIGVNSSNLPAICIGEVRRQDRELVTVLGPVLDLYRRNPGLRSELLGEAFDHRVNSARELLVLNPNRTNTSY